MVNFSLRDFLMGFGDPLALRGARSTRWLARIGAWIAALFLPTLLLYFIYSAANSWPDLFTSQSPLSALSNGAFWLIALGSYASILLNKFSRARRLPPVITSEAPYPTTARALALALLGAARAGDDALAPRATDAQRNNATSESAVEPEEIAPLASPLLDTTPRSGMTREIEALGLLVAAGSLAFAGYVAATSVFPLVGPRSSVADWGMVIVAGAWGALGALIGCAIIAWGNTIGRFAKSVRWGICVVVDAEGVTARYRNARGAVIEEVYIAWRDVQVLTQLKYSDSNLRQHTVYTLSASHGSIQWEAPPEERYAPAVARERIHERRESAARLLRAARVGAGLPLRDLSATFAALREDRPGLDDAQLRVASVRSAYSMALREGDDEDLTRDLWRLLNPPEPNKTKVEPTVARMLRYDRLTNTYATRYMTIMTFADRQRILGAVRALLPYLPAGQESDPVVQDSRLDMSNPARGARYLQRKGPFAWLAPLVYLAWLCAFIFFPGAIASATAGYSAPLEHALPAAVAAETPIYITPLTAAQPGWLVRAPRGSDSSSAAFTPQGYALASFDQALVDEDQTFVVAAPHIVMGDGAAQVTVNLAPGAGEQDAYNTAGLLLEAPSEAAGVVFEIDTDNRWTLTTAHRSGAAWSTDFEEIAHGESSAIATTGPNTLLVVRRGQTYLLYINERFVQAVHDDTARIAPGGPVALMLDNSEGAVRFTNLAVYPVPPDLPFWAR